MKAKTLLVCFAFILSACVSKTDFDNAIQHIEELKAQVATLQAENAELKSQVANLQGEGTELKSRLAKKPDLPVTLALRQAFTGPGYVAVFNTTVKSPVAVIATVTSSALGNSKRFELRLNPTGPTELGHLEGVVIENGDTITLENNNYSPATFTINAK